MDGRCTTEYEITFLILESFIISRKYQRKYYKE
jgi:hypothetical protein